VLAEDKPQREETTEGERERIKKLSLFFILFILIPLLFLLKKIDKMN